MRRWWQRVDEVAAHDPRDARAAVGLHGPMPGRRKAAGMPVGIQLRGQLLRSALCEIVVQAAWWAEALVRLRTLGLLLRNRRAVRGGRRLDVGADVRVSHGAVSRSSRRRAASCPALATPRSTIAELVVGLYGGVHLKEIPFQRLKGERFRQPACTDQAEHLLHVGAACKVLQRADIHAAVGVSHRGGFPLMRLLRITKTSPRADEASST